jgi:hypothetical protein
MVENDDGRERAAKIGSRIAFSAAGRNGVPKLMSFSRPSTRYFIRHRRAALGLTSR